MNELKELKKLKRCHFCKKDHAFIIRSERADGNSFVLCSYCLARGPLWVTGDCNDFALIKQWNEANK